MLQQPFFDINKYLKLIKEIDKDISYPTQIEKDYFDFLYKNAQSIFELDSIERNNLIVNLIKLYYYDCENSLNKLQPTININSFIMLMPSIYHGDQQAFNLFFMRAKNIINQQELNSQFIDINDKVANKIQTKLTEAYYKDFVNLIN